MAATVTAFPFRPNVPPSDEPPTPPAVRPSKTWDKQAIVDLIAEDSHRSNVFIEHALVALYDRQTCAEQDIEQTTDSNGVGFGAFDAVIFSSFAKQILASKWIEGRQLTTGQLGVCRKLVGKSHPIPRLARYAGQLLEITEEKRSRKLAA